MCLLVRLAQCRDTFFRKDAFDSFQDNLSGDLALFNDEIGYFARLNQFLEFAIGQCFGVRSEEGSLQHHNQEQDEHEVRSRELVRGRLHANFFAFAGPQRSRLDALSRVEIQVWWSGIPTWSRIARHSDAESREISIFVVTFAVVNGWDGLSAT